jgi:two-component system alkaline phosphatase synthesis response regulator PhoP
MAKKILIVDDEEDIVELLSYNLEKEGYKCYTASNGQKAIDKAIAKNPDLILMDIMMPEMDGLTATKELRKLDQFKQTYIVFLTARGEEYSEIAGFEAGADDYITKPVKIRVLLSRLKAIFKRGEKEGDMKPVLTFGTLVIDRGAYTVTIDGTKTMFPKKEFELLYLLASKPGKVYTREKILDKVWGSDVYVVDRTIDVHIRKIREKIGDNLISTIKGVGYKFEE